MENGYNRFVKCQNKGKNMVAIFPSKKTKFMLNTNQSNIVSFIYFLGYQPVMDQRIYRQYIAHFFRILEILFSGLQRAYFHGKRVSKDNIQCIDNIIRKSCYSTFSGRVGAYNQHFNSFLDFHSFIF